LGSSQCGGRNKEHPRDRRKGSVNLPGICKIPEWTGNKVESTRFRLAKADRETGFIELEESFKGEIFLDLFLDTDFPEILQDCRTFPVNAQCGSLACNRKIPTHRNAAGSHPIQEFAKVVLLEKGTGIFEERRGGRRFQETGKTRKKALGAEFFSEGQFVFPA
jgi:hypothetical protein